MEIPPVAGYGVGGGIFFMFEKVEEFFDVFFNTHSTDNKWGLSPFFLFFPDFFVLCIFLIAAPFFSTIEMRLAFDGAFF